MRRFLAVLVVASGLVLVSGVEPALACSCEGGRSVSQRINDSDVAFVGTGLRNDELKGIATFRVDDAVKGVDEGDLVEIASDHPASQAEADAGSDGPAAALEFGGGTCREVLPMDREVGVTASRADDGRLTVGTCNLVSLDDLRDYAEARDRLPWIAIAGISAIGFLFFVARRNAARRQRGAD